MLWDKNVSKTCDLVKGVRSTCSCFLLIQLSNINIFKLLA